MLDERARGSLFKEDLPVLQISMLDACGRWCDSGTEFDDAIGERQQPLIVGGDQDRAIGIGEPPQEGEHALHLDVVEVSGRLISENDRRIQREGAGNGNSLLLAAGHRSRPVSHPVSKINHLEQVFGTIACDRTGLTRGPADEFDVLPRAERGDEVESLKHDSDRRLAVVVERLTAIPTTSQPSTQTDPDTGRSSPAMTDSSVDFPQPLAPRITPSFPRSI